MSAIWLADVLRAAGLTVDETLVPDWKQRGHTDGPFAPIGVLGHHTAGGASGDLPSLATVRDGRSDLAGPLANLMLSRAGVWVPIAAGRCWHAGAADNQRAWPWVPNGDGNGYLIGIEAESTGHGDWTPEQRASYPRGVAALLAHLGAGPDRFLGHLEWAPTRKIDPAGWPGGMNGFRQSVTASTSEEFTVAQYDDIMAKLEQIRTEAWQQHKDMANFNGTIVGHVAQILTGSHTDGTDRLTDLWNRLGDIQTALGTQPSGSLPSVQPIDVGALAKAIEDEADRRSRDGDPATGPVS